MTKPKTKTTKTAPRAAAAAPPEHPGPAIGGYTVAKIVGYRGGYAAVVGARKNAAGEVLYDLAELKPTALGVSAAELA